MNVPFVDLKEQYKSIKEEVFVEMNEVLDNTAYICGKKAKKFEEDFAKMHDSANSLVVSNGTAALHVALHGIGIKPGDEVIVQANTFIATAEGVSLCGATPVFVDNDEKTYNIDVTKIEASITKKTRAILPVHLYGQPAEMDPILEIAKKHKLHVVEDCSQAHLATYKGKKIGSMGIAGTFSFYPGKNLGAYGEGGAVTTSDSELYKFMLLFRQHGSIEKYVHEMAGANYRLEELQAGVLNVKMKYIEKWTEDRRRLAALYTKTLGEMNIEQVVTPYHPEHVNPVYHLYIIRAERRDELSKFLNEKGVQTGLHYPTPLHMTKAYSSLGYKPDDFPVAKKYADEILSIPMYPEMTDEMVQYTCETIKAFYRG